MFAAVLAAAALADGARAQAVNLVVRAGTSIAGAACGPWNCVPSPLAASAGSTLSLEMGTQLGAPIFLLLALPPTGCASVPGFGGSLIVQPPGVALLLAPPSWGLNYISNPPAGPCATRVGYDSLVLPPTLPSGAQFVMQTLAPDFPAAAAPWAFSNAVLVTIQ